MDAVTVEEPILTPEATPRGLRAPGTTVMIAGSLVGAVGAYLFQVVGGRRLGTAGFAPIGVLWTVFFIVATVILVPLEQFFTREASRGRVVLREDWRPAVTVIGIAAAFTAGFVLIANRRLFNGQPVFILQAFLMVVLFGWMQVGKGVLAAHRHFKQYGMVLSAEGVIRLVAAIAVLAVSATASSLAWAMVAAPLAIMVARPWRFDRGRPELERTSATRFLGGYGLGSAASQVLLAGAPLGVTVLGGDAALFSVVFVTFTLFRAPLTLIYNLQGRILPFLVRMNHVGDKSGIERLTRRVMSAGGILIAAAGLVGWLVGPLVVGLLFGDDFRPTRLVAAAVAVGVIAASTTQVTGQVLVAAGATGVLAQAWVLGLLVALTFLGLGGGTPDATVATAFVVGELAATTVVAVRVLRSR
jgi:O-antigen/teichoic acid export membrane protein